MSGRKCQVGDDSEEMSRRKCLGGDVSMQEDVRKEMFGRRC